MRGTLVDAVKVLVSELHFHVQPRDQIDCIPWRLGIRKEKFSFVVKMGRQKHSLT